MWTQALFGGDLALTSGAPPVRGQSLSQEGEAVTRALPLRSPLPPADPVSPFSLPSFPGPRS